MGKETFERRAATDKIHKLWEVIGNAFSKIILAKLPTTCCYWKRTDVMIGPLIRVCTRVYIDDISERLEAQRCYDRSAYSCVYAFG